MRSAIIHLFQNALETKSISSVLASITSHLFSESFCHLRNHPGHKLSCCQHCRGRPAHSALSLLGEKVFKHETREEAAISAAWVLRTNPQFAKMDTPTQWLSALKISFTPSAASRREQLVASQQGAPDNPKSWDAATSTYFLLIHRHQKLSAWGRLSA